MDFDGFFYVMKKNGFSQKILANKLEITESTLSAYKNMITAIPFHVAYSVEHLSNGEVSGWDLMCKSRKLNNIKEAK